MKKDIGSNVREGIWFQEYDVNVPELGKVGVVVKNRNYIYIKKGRNQFYFVNQVKVYFDHYAIIVGIKCAKAIYWYTVSFLIGEC